MGDFNNDGVQDLAVTSDTGDTVSVLLGNHDGTFQAQRQYPVGAAPIDIAVGDFNGDGIFDLAIANADSNNVGILLGNGDGSFKAQVTYPAGRSPSSVATGDLNSDGKLDLVTANNQGVSVLLGNGDGMFQAETEYPAGSASHAVALSDLNGDGVLDVASATDDNTVAVLLGNGDGTLQTAVTYPASGNNILDISFGDLNGDGVPDVVVPNFDSNSMYVLLGSVTQTATATLSPVAPVGTGTHQAQAQYAGDAFNSASSSSTVALTATPRQTGLSFVVSANPVIAGQSVTLTAMLSGYSYQSFTTTGEPVTFYSGSAALGSAPLNSNGQANFVTSSLPAGADSLTAQYAGDGNFTAASSNVVMLVVNAAPASFTITPSPSSETVSRGVLGGFVLTVKSVNGFGGMVSLSCSGGPTGSYCLNLPMNVSLQRGTAYALSGIFFPKKSAPGTYTITFTGNSGNSTSAATAKFTVK